eukprot:CAMPEP_0185585878 /NCGR_PEP_ID=MMETSP0434-20130131/41508_1 /TAXON_ID=626734 ORGANISM="Favella taraikaensis, Strain Fe Narragansett Bay" /NCGR_SAMPLE_ID=MMETSP0434 /ASSEMBLY_ACC=CAM_ASM_000379 /LENGTH=52 /DNA_ID=CAMNT_0028206557 /DNA_START=464 /DNA_END=622 /DNA_ORIENTATION=-
MHDAKSVESLNATRDISHDAFGDFFNIVTTLGTDAAHVLAEVPTFHILRNHV